MKLERLLLTVILKLGSRLVLIMVGIGRDDGMGALKIIWRFATDAVGLVREGAYACPGRSGSFVGYEFEQIGLLHAQLIKLVIITHRRQTNIFALTTQTASNKLIFN